MDESVLKILRDKYFLKDDSGTLVETEPNQMYRRVAKAVASVETEPEKKKEYEEKFYTLMSNCVFMPNSPTLMNAGTHIKSLAACFVVDIEDSREGIHSALGDGMEIFASGGGVGFPFSKLRPRGDMVVSTRGKASGPVSFAHMFDAMTETIMQGGKRRGASMGTLRVDHPDVIEFIQVKRDKKKLNNFNLSVLLTDEFMQACEENASTYWAKDPKTGEPRGFNRADGTVGPINPNEILDNLVSCAWGTGEPGVYFIDNANNAHPFTDKTGKMSVMGPNPCGEAVLRAYESCVLGSINLSKFVNPTITGGFDFVELRRVVKTAVRFLDNVVSYSEPPLEKIKVETQYTRKIGLGVMGLHNTLLLMKLPYSLSKSNETKELVSKIFDNIEKAAGEATVDLAKEKGAFPAWDESTFRTKRWAKRRNASILSIAPTGTIARICDTSFGIEPVMAWQTEHNLTDVQYTETHKLAEPYLSKGEELPDYFETATEISAQDHLDMQILVQSYVDQAVSKTVNLPNSASKEAIHPLFISAWKGGLKGFTVYRDGSRAEQPISATKDINQLYETPSTETHCHPERERTSVMYGPSYKIATPEGNVYLDIHNNTNDEVCEIMLQLGDGFTDTEKSLANWIARVYSKSLQHGIEYHELVKQGASTEFETKSRAYPGRVFWYGTNGKKKAYRSIPEVVSDLLIQQVNTLVFDEDDDTTLDSTDGTISSKCPECGAVSYYQGGCWSCSSCWWSKCT